MKRFFTKLRHFAITNKQKAVVAFIASSVGSYLVQNGLTLKDVASVSGLQSLAVGVATHMFVYFTTNH